MSKLTVSLTDVKRDDGRRGVRIHMTNDTPQLKLLGGEPMCTAAQLIGISLVETARKICDEMGFVIEEVE